MTLSIYSHLWQRALCSSYWCSVHFSSWDLHDNWFTHYRIKTWNIHGDAWNWWNATWRAAEGRRPVSKISCIFFSQRNFLKNLKKKKIPSLLESCNNLILCTAAPPYPWGCALRSPVHPDPVIGLNPIWKYVSSYMYGPMVKFNL